MSVLAKVGIFSTPNATGTQAITGVGFQPTFIFFISGLTTTTGVSSSIRFCVGWTAGVGEDIAFYMTGGDGGTQASMTHRRDACINRCQLGGTRANIDLALLSSFDADGFTLSWTQINATATDVAYLALGGDVSAFAGAGPTIPTSGSSVALTGVGFTPAAVISGNTREFLAPSQNGGNCALGFGVSSGSGQTASADLTTANGASGSASDFSSSALMNGLTSAAVSFFAASLASMDADGFTISVGSNPSSSVPSSVAALSGGQMRAGSFTKKTSTGTQAVTGVGFQPKAGIFFSQYYNAIHDNALVAVGISDGTTEATVGYQTVGSDRDRLWLTDKAIATLDTTDTVAGSADLQSWDSDGFTLNWTAADAQASGIGYLVFGDAAAPSTFKPRSMVF